MKRFGSLSTIILISSIIISCCNSINRETMKSDQKAFIPGSRVIIYKTKKDYSKFVPIILNENKKSIDSYPDVKDIDPNKVLAYPTKLHNDYWLDNRGISVNVAFINLTYEEYSRLLETPSTTELMNMIIDDQPLIDMYSCGARPFYLDIEKELNKKIDTNDFSTFTKIK